MRDHFRRPKRPQDMYQCQSPYPTAAQAGKKVFRSFPIPLEYQKSRITTATTPFTSSDVDAQHDRECDEDEDAFGKAPKYHDAGDGST